MIPETDSLLTVLERAIKASLARVHVGMVGRVERYDYQTQRVDVQPVVRGKYDDGESFRFPQLLDVPVRFPSSSKFALTFPIERGDFVWLDFGERSLDEWRALGGGDVDPSVARRFDLSDAVAYAGIRPDGQPLASAEPNKLVLGQEDGPLRLRIGPGGIEIGDGTNELLTLVHDLVSALQSATVATSIGTQPLDPATQVKLGTIAAALSAIKV